MDVETRARELAGQMQIEAPLPGEALDLALATAAIVFRRMQATAENGGVEFADALFISQAQVLLAATPA